MKYLVRALVNISACQANCRRLRKAAGRRKLFAVVKADGYGHGMVPVSKAIADEVDGLCVFTVADGEVLRHHGIKLPVLIMGGFDLPEHLDSLVANELWVAIYNRDQLDMLRATKAALPRVFVKVQTGMHRLGFDPTEVAGVLAELAKCEVKQVGLMHHFATAEQADGTRAQSQVMADLVASSGLSFTASNTAATLFASDQGEEFVRCGIGIYGCTPSSHKEHTARELGLYPVMQLVSEVLATQTVPAGSGVGYGLRWVATRDTTIAVVAGGYAHGYPRRASDGTPVWVAGHELELVGQVAMEMQTVELTNGNVAKGTAVELWGEHIPVDLVAQRAGTIAYELLASLPSSVVREYSNHVT